MMSLAKPSAANRTIFARMTSRYGDVYLRALAVSSSRSILLNSMEYGLRRGIGTSRSGVCQTKRKSTLKIRHYIYEHEYLALGRAGSGRRSTARTGSVGQQGRGYGQNHPRMFAPSS